MMLPDVNVLIEAFRADAPRHALCHGWLDRAINGVSRLGLSRLTLSAVVRVTTSRRIYIRPDSLDHAFTFCRALIDHPNAFIVEPGERHWDIFRGLCVAADIRGPKVSDAYFAALALEWGCEWVTLDRDFARFPGLKWSAPSLEV